MYHEAAEQICLLISNIEHFDRIDDQHHSFRPAEDEHNFLFDMKPEKRNYLHNDIKTFHEPYLNFL